MPQDDSQDDVFALLAELSNRSHPAAVRRWEYCAMVSVDPSGTGTVSEQPRRPIPTSASYSITVRLQADPDPAVVGRIATAVGTAPTRIAPVKSALRALTASREGRD